MSAPIDMIKVMFDHKKSVLINTVKNCLIVCCGLAHYQLGQFESARYYVSQTALLF